MTVIENPLLLRKKAAAAEAYQIEKSIRFNEADSAHLLRTTGSKGNRRIWTWAAWVKRWDVENRSTLFSAGDGQSDTGWTAIEIETDEKLKVTEKGVFVERGKSTDPWGKGWIKVVEKEIK